ncbi:MAG: hypothetical protein ACRD0S_04390, partial [Acidimicrobiales bacterium]
MLVIGAVVFLAVHALVSGAVGDLDPWTVAAWLVFCAVANLLPIPVSEHVSLSLSSSANIAVALVFPMRVAGPLVFLAALSEWELRRQTNILHALYNRAQLGMSVAAAAAALDLHQLPSGGLNPLAALGAILAYQVTNLVLVAAAEATCRSVPFLGVARRMMPTGPAAA